MKAIDGTMKRLGCAKRIRVTTPLGTRRQAWDCRAFGHGRVITPILPIQIELSHGVHLDVHTGEVRSAATDIAA
jgi:hypothetical protein